jgi:hypothetical protein
VHLAIRRLPGFLWILSDFINNNNAFHTRLNGSATILVRVPTPEDGCVRPKHVVEEYTQDKYKNKTVAFRAVITFIYRSVMLGDESVFILRYVFNPFVKYSVNGVYS